MRQLTPNDAFMLYTEAPGSPNQIASLLILDPSTAPGGTLTFEMVQEFYASRVHLAKAFRRRLARVPFDLDDPWWVEDGNFDLEYHLRHVALPAPGDWRQLCTFIARLHSRPLDLTRPPWESYLIEGLNAIPGVPEGAFAILLRVHHTAVDGVGGIELMSALFQLAPDEDPPPAEDNWRPEVMPSQWDLFGRAAVANAHRPFRFARGVTRALPGAVRLPGRIRGGEVRLPSLSVPSTRFNARVSPHRVFDGINVSLPDVKAMKSTVAGATVNDVVLTVCAGALRTYLEKHAELPSGTLAAVVPMSVRTEGEKGAEGNKVAQFFCPLHTDVADPRARLEAVAESARIAKGSAEALAAHALMQMSIVVPGALFGMALRANAEIARRTGSAGLLNTQISNIPGPPFPLYCAGAKLLRMYGMGPVVTGAALIHVVMSYCDQMTFAFTSDRDLMPDPDVYAEALASSFGELRAATVG